MKRAAGQSSQPWAAPLAPIDVSPCGILRAASVLRKFDYACTNQLRSCSRAHAGIETDYYCVVQSFRILPFTAGNLATTGDFHAQLFIHQISKSSVSFVGSLFEAHTGRLCAVVSRKFVRVYMQEGTKRGLPFTNDERLSLVSDCAPPSLTDHLHDLDQLPSQFTGMPEKPMFTQTVQPRHINSANHLDHGCLLQLCVDSASLARGDSPISKAPHSGKIEYLFGGVGSGACLDCFSDTVGSTSIVCGTAPTRDSPKMNVCRAAFAWT